MIERRGGILHRETERAGRGGPGIPGGLTNDTPRAIPRSALQHPRERRVSGEIENPALRRVVPCEQLREILVGAAPGHQQNGGGDLDRLGIGAACDAGSRSGLPVAGRHARAAHRAYPARWTRERFGVRHCRGLRATTTALPFKTAVSGMLRWNRARSPRSACRAARSAPKSVTTRLGSSRPERW